MKLKLLLPAALLLLLGACRHKQSQPETIYVDKATRQHFAFKPGSYWIYKDSISGRVDSCYVTAIDSSLRHNDEYTKIYQTIHSELVQRPIVNPLSDSLTIWIGLGNGNVGIGYNTTDFLNHRNFGLQLTYPFKLGRMNITPDSGMVTEIIPELVSGGERYSNVIECFSRISKSPEDYAWFYFNDSVAFIKIRLYADKGLNYVWELQQCHIIK
jgi:hypothetical protein